MRWLGVLALLLALARTSSAAPLSVVVLYFDNNTGDRELDVLSKGFADMMVTDLSSVSGVQVVEREKLEQLLAELKLQRGKYFDPKTAVSVGRGVGARYALTGSFQAIAPEIRIDVRLVDIQSAAVVLADKIVGERSKIFALEEALVRKLVTGLSLKLGSTWRPRGGAEDLGTLLDYSRGVDLGDRGDLDGAAKALGGVVRKAPAFVLARSTLKKLEERLVESRKRREGTIDERARTLIAHASSAVTATAGADAERARTRLAYRNILRWAALRDVRPLLTPKELIRRGKEAEARRRLVAYVDASVALLDDLHAYAARHTQTAPNGVRWLDTSARLPAEDAALANEGGFRRSFEMDPVRVASTTAECVLAGRCEDGSDDVLIIGPPLADLEARFEAIGLSLLEAAWKEAEAGRQTQPHLEHAAISVLDTWAEVLLLRRGKKAAVEKWQEILDRHPTSPRYANIEKIIQRQLGITHDHTVQSLEAYPRAIEACDDMEVRKSMDEMIWWRSRREGVPAILGVVKEIEDACRGRPSMKRFWEYLYSHAALFGASHRDCELFDRFMARHVAEGGSAGDAASYRKNYAPFCPAEGARSP